MTYTDIYVWDVDIEAWVNIGGLSGGDVPITGVMGGTGGVYTFDLEGYTLTDGDRLFLEANEDISGYAETTLSINGGDAFPMYDGLEMPLDVAEGDVIPLVYIEQIGVFVNQIPSTPYNNYQETDPTADDDILDRYSIGSFWTNTVSGDVFTCLENGEGAAVWQNITSTGGTTEDPPVCGSSTFNGYATGRVITHDFGTTDYDVAVMPSADPSGLIGQVWYTKSADTVAIKCSGTATTAFDYRITKWPAS